MWQATASTFTGWSFPQVGRASFGPCKHGLHHVKRLLRTFALTKSADSVSGFCKWVLSQNRRKQFYLTCRWLLFSRVLCRLYVGQTFQE